MKEKRTTKVTYQDLFEPSVDEFISRKYSLNGLAAHRRIRGRKRGGNSIARYWLLFFILGCVTFVVGWLLLNLVRPSGAPEEDSFQVENAEYVRLELTGDRLQEAREISNPFVYPYPDIETGSPLPGEAEVI